MSWPDRPPLFNIYAVRAAASINPKPDAVEYCELTDRIAVWRGRVDFVQRVFREGEVIEILRRSVLADILAVGNESFYTSDRGIRATFTFLDTSGKQQLRYAVSETPTGINYAVSRFTGRVHSRVLGYAAGGYYPYRRRRPNPHSPLTAADIAFSPDRYDSVAYNEDFTTAFLRAAGVNLQQT